MTPHLETTESVAQGIDEDRAQIVETQESHQAILDRDIDALVSGGPSPNWRESRPKRIE